MIIFKQSIILAIFVPKITNYLPNQRSTNCIITQFKFIIIFELRKILLMDTDIIN